ncbi:NAD(P)-dependent oxidoreductase [Alkalicoccobacillus plakortidis]|uniref:DUF1932 domain-containing protein n=1 Tax=Alkalicoccobacillus plakortidis TaxID=444060 RepID=A0ABT0XNW8_9BACI|nr:NAD(P)-dependent oxidoreductase [Alkalicoccobacillus plakortidis]MCM2677598.1 DUF1932 domain-containing protein [Alkalicoccobacillus plakortidis]
MKIGFLGFGEAAFELSTGLKEEGLTSIKAFDVMANDDKFGPQIKSRAQSVGIQLQDSLSELLPDIDVLFVAVPASKALEVSATVCSQLNGSSFLYVDVSASSPNVKQEIEKGLSDVDIPFVDVAMLGPLPVFKHKVPISASGNGTEELIKKMEPYHMNITSVGNKAGDASAVKLIRSVFMKGIVGLYLETLQASETFNVSSEVLSSLEDTMDSHSFMDTLNRLITGTAVHAERRAFELNGSVEMLQEAGLNANLTSAAKDKLLELAEISAKYQGEDKPLTWKEVISRYDL